MKIVAIDKILPGTTPETVQPHLKEESRVAWELYKSDVMREMYFRTDRPGAVLILECNSIEEAKSELARLPLVKEKLIDFELIPVGHFSPFESLMNL